MPSFDTVLEADFVEVKNAVDQVAKEIGTRFDFKGTSAAIEFKDKDKEITLFGDADFQLTQVNDVLIAKLAKRGVDVRFLDLSAKPEKMGSDKVKQAVPVKMGIDSESARRIQGLIKQSKLGPVARLMPTSAAMTLRKDGDPPLVLDGPFAETKEQLLGFYVVDCATQEEALEAARLIGTACTSRALEVRPISWSQLTDSTGH